MYPIVWSKGKYLHKDSLMFPLEERGLQFGDGVYEVIRVYRGDMYLLDEHIDRLYRSLKSIRITLNFTPEEVKGALKNIVERNKVDEDAFIYLQVTRGSAARDHLFPENVEPNIYAYVKRKKRPIELLEKGIKAITLKDERWDNCYIKSLNLLPNVLAKQLAADRGAFEAILHRDNVVTEGSSSNIFLVKDDVIYTHPESKYILSGCVRSRVIHFANELGINVREEPFHVSDIEKADEMFLTSSTSEIMAIVQVNDMTIGEGKPGEITRRLQKEYEKDAAIVQEEVSR